MYTTWAFPFLDFSHAIMETTCVDRDNLRGLNTFHLDVLLQLGVPIDKNLFASECIVINFTLNLGLFPFEFLTLFYSSWLILFLF